MNKPFKFIGSVSSGTLRSEDLIPTFLGLLHELEPGRELNYPRESDDPMDVVNDLIDDLNNYAPPYFYFGAHPGDGADFGFWFDHWAFDYAVEENEILKVDSLAGDGEEGGYRSSTFDDAKADEYEYVAVVSDHGNVTLYDLEGNEIWGIV